MKNPALKKINVLSVIVICMAVVICAQHSLLETCGYCREVGEIEIGYETKEKKELPESDWVPSVTEKFVSLIYTGSIIQSAVEVSASRNNPEICIINQTFLQMAIVGNLRTAETYMLKVSREGMAFLLDKKAMHVEKMEKEFSILNSYLKRLADELQGLMISTG